MYRRPRDAKEALFLIETAHRDSHKYIDEYASYGMFWKSLEILLQTTIFKKLDVTIARNPFSQILVNAGCSTFEKMIREAEWFENAVLKEKKHRKYQHRCNKYQKFVDDLLFKTQKCIDRPEVEADLRQIAVDLNTVFSDKDVVEGIRILYITMKTFRRMLRLTQRRIDNTFLKYTTFGTNEALDNAEAQEILSNL